MKRFKGGLAAGFCLIQGLISASAFADFRSYSTNFYPKPRLIQNNSEALNLRLALLDLAPAGAKVRIATFVFDYGTAVETLSAHMCAARKRGVSVELLVDSKAGERAGVDDAFDASKETKKSEELFQYMANCGVQVNIHNAQVDFVKVLGKRMPNIFGVPTGSSINPISLLSRVNEIKSRMSELLRPTLNRLGIRSDIKNVMNSAQTLVLETNQLISLAGAQTAGDAESGNMNSGVDTSIEIMAKNYRNLINDPLWSEVDSAKMTEITGAVREVLTTDPDINLVREKIRTFNRLNHRKLFMVETAPGEGCVIIGGRNLGDHYLTDGKGSFHDADIFVCSHHAPEAGKLIGEARESFEDLIQNKDDFILGKKTPDMVRTVGANRAATYGNLDLRRIALTRVAVNAPVSGIELPGMLNPILLTSAWNPHTDQIRLALLEGIAREQKEIYIETAYAEFNASIRRAIEKALKRGVRVRIVTNGLFISDGSSKLIRLWMAPWTAEMSAKYPKLFTTLFATLSGGHMIHFKGAGFRCQKGLTGAYRMYLVGSHNFHPRSGYSDKEHAVEWRETTDPACTPPANDLIALRRGYYAQLQKKTVDPILANYDGLYAEFSYVMDQNEDPASRDLARALTRTLYIYDPATSQYKLNYAKQFRHVEDILDDSGFRDLIGTLL